MAESPKNLCLYNVIKERPSPNNVEKLIRKGIDCNLSCFDGETLRFISPIQLAIENVENDQDETLCLLYEHRNSSTKLQLRKHVTFYENHYIQSQDEENETLFDYNVSRLLYMRMTEYPKKALHTLNVGLLDYNGVELRGEDLCEGSTLLILLQLRIYTLFQKIIEMTINSRNNMIEVIEDELLHNLETYYFLDGIFRIPVKITREIISKKFTEIESSQQFKLRKYYECIAKNIIKKIKELEINKEYTIPTGWIGHAICVSFRRITETHISIRIDNSSPDNPPNMHEIVKSVTGQDPDQIRPKILGQLHIDDLEDNLDYFISLIDSIKRDLTLEEGVSLIYNINGQICKLDKTQIENVPSFDIQADANCFVKCYEPGFSIRFGTTYYELYQQLLLLENANAVVLARRCEQALRFAENYTNLLEEGKRYLCYLDKLYDRFTSLAEEDNISSLAVPVRERLQYQLKTSYKQHYQYLLGNKNRGPSSCLIKRYVPLRFENNGTSIELKTIFIEPRVLLVGEAGYGKTTICQYVTYRWACEKLWKNKFEWLFYIEMRNLNSKDYPSPSNNYSLIDIIERECFRGYILNDLDKRKLTNLFGNPSNILWILDGCDERTIPDYLHLIERELLDKPHLFLTSRKYVTDDLQYDVKIEIQTFSDKDIESYIAKYFSIMAPKKTSKCCEFIRCSEQLKETARIPACLEIMCDLWDNGYEIFDRDLTMGKLYEKMCEYRLRRYLLKFHGQSTRDLAGKDIYQQLNAEAFTRLEHVAFEMTKSHKLMIRGDELRDIADSLLLSVIQIGLLITNTPNPSLVLTENIYEFVHRSFQEYLCARYMIRTLSSVHLEEKKEEVIQFITDEKYNRNLQNTFRLFFELERSISCTDQFWSAVAREPRDLVGLRHCSRIIRWFPNGICGLSPDDEEKISKRTINVVQEWISNKNRRAHDFSNKYLFEWFESFTVLHPCWLKAWKEDLLEKDSSSRRYFLPDLWSTENIDALTDIYDTISKNDVKALHSLIMKGPTKVNLRRLHIDPNLFTVPDDTKAQRRRICRNLRKCFPTKCCSSNKVPSKIQKFPPTPWVPTDSFCTSTEVSRVVIATQRKAIERESITNPGELEVLLRNYATFASLNRQTEALDKETWRLKIDPSALKNINNESLKLLLQLSQQNALFDRDVELPVIPFLELCAKQNDLDDDILCSLIVSITFSSKFILTAPPGERKLIRVHKKDDTSVDIELDQQRWDPLITKFDSARTEYGYSSFFST